MLKTNKGQCRSIPNGLRAASSTGVGVCKQGEAPQANRELITSPSARQAEIRLIKKNDAFPSISVYTQLFVMSRKHHRGWWLD
jgi:hypothetical protein